MIYALVGLAIALYVVSHLWPLWLLIFVVVVVFGKRRAWRD